MVKFHPPPVPMIPIQNYLHNMLNSKFPDLLKSIRSTNLLLKYVTVFHESFLPVISKFDEQFEIVKKLK